MQNSVEVHHRCGQPVGIVFEVSLSGVESLTQYHRPLYDADARNAFLTQSVIQAHAASLVVA